MAAENEQQVVHKPLSRAQSVWRWKILIATYFGYCGYYLTRKVYTLIMKTLNAQYGWSLSALGDVWAAYLIAYMAGQFINSYLGRRFGPRVLLLGGLGASISINLVFCFTHSYWVFMVMMILLGLVQASGWAGSVGSVAGWLRRHERGTIMGVWNTNFVLGNIMVKGLGGFILKTGWHAMFVACAAMASKDFCWNGEANNWRYAFLGCTLVAALIWLLLLFWQRNEPEDVGLEKIIETECDETRPVHASTEDQITFKQYLALLANPVILSMGTCYFCLKFIRYALDTWTPTLLQVLHFDVGKSAYYSMIFDFVGIPGVLFAGWALDHWFKGKWTPLCLLMGIGMIIGYIFVVVLGGNPYLFAICCGLVGFMLYGPDSIVNGAAAMHVAGEKNTTAVTGIINGMGSLGAVIQSFVIGRLLEGDNGMRNSNILGLGVSVAFVLLILLVIWQVKQAGKRNTACS